MSVAIRAVVFDIGGVLLDWDPRHLYRQLIADAAELDFFLDSICTRQWHREHDLGADTEQSCRELAGRHPEYRELIMAWSRRSEEMIGGVFAETVDILAELTLARVPCYALSNMETDKFALRRSRYAFLNMFRGLVISGAEGVAKPDRKIFEILLSRYQLEPAATVFVDDSPANVTAARELGLVAIGFTSGARLRCELRGLGLPVGPGGPGPEPGHSS